MGKVHGSMARAGKVRNQTPKVDKQERARKRQTGRAKKRLQYKKRIINVDPNDKRKKGPNFGAGKKVEETKWGPLFVPQEIRGAPCIKVELSHSWWRVIIIRDSFFITLLQQILFKKENWAVKAIPFVFLSPSVFPLIYY